MLGRECDLHGDRVVGSALHGSVISDQSDKAAMHAANACDNAS